MNADPDSDDHIDQSAWLPDGEPIITPEREAKGDLKVHRDESGDIQEAKATVRNILNFLWNQDAITDDQHNAGWIFKAWRDQHRVAMGMQKACGGDGNPESGIAKLRAYGFILIVKRLSVYDYRAVDSAVETFESEYTRFLALVRRQTYRRALERLETILPPIRERIAFLEGLPEDERNAMADEALKNFVDGIVKNV